MIFSYFHCHQPSNNFRVSFFLSSFGADILVFFGIRFCCVIIRGWRPLTQIGLHLPRCRTIFNTCSIHLFYFIFTRMHIVASYRFYLTFNYFDLSEQNEKSYEADCENWMCKRSRIEKKISYHFHISYYYSLHVVSIRL